MSRTTLVATCLMTVTGAGLITTAALEHTQLTSSSTRLHVAGPPTSSDRITDPDYWNHHGRAV